MAPRTCLFKKGTSLALKGEENTILLCRTAEDVYLDRVKFKVNWINKDETSSDPDVFVRTPTVEKVDIRSVIYRVQLRNISKKNRTTSFYSKCRLPKQEKEKLTTILKNLDMGYGLYAYEKTSEKQPTSEVIFLEKSLDSSRKSPSRETDDEEPAICFG